MLFLLNIIYGVSHYRLFYKFTVVSRYGLFQLPCMVFLIFLFFFCCCCINALQPQSYNLILIPLQQVDGGFVFELPQVCAAPSAMESIHCGARVG